MAIITGQYPSGYAETIIGTPEDDTIYPLGGWDTVDGGLGIDTVVVMADSSAFKITADNGTTYVDAISSASSYDFVSLRNVEYIRFNDKTVSLIIDDRIVNKPGSENLDGGPGIDTVVYGGPSGNYKVSISADGRATVQNKQGLEGSDNLLSIERLEFSDVDLALDFAGNGHAAVVAKILGAVFGRESVANKTYAGVGLYYMDSGWSYQDLAALALQAAGANTPEQIVSLLWKNVVGTTATTAEKSPFIDMLDHGMTPGALAQLAGDHALNTNNIDLVGLANAGLAYIPFDG